MERYLVVGVYTDDVTYERFADDYRAHSAEAAEALAVAQHPGLTVAAVINEEGQVVA